MEHFHTFCAFKLQESLYEPCCPSIELFSFKILNFNIKISDIQKLIYASFVVFGGYEDCEFFKAFSASV